MWSPVPTPPLQNLCAATLCRNGVVCYFMVTPYFSLVEAMLCCLLISASCLPVFSYRPRSFFLLLFNIQPSQVPRSACLPTHRISPPSKKAPQKRPLLSLRKKPSSHPVSSNVSGNVGVLCSCPPRSRCARGRKLAAAPPPPPTRSGWCERIKATRYVLIFFISFMPLCHPG